ncbi:MAG: cysteine synthase A, partial [Clostridia bacterium]|nr:cysteine synthase A [Clostridia bacterium]
MAKIYSSLTELIGNTPLLEIKNYNKKNNLKAKIICKIEYFNPTGSIKDRIAKSMILDAEKSGLLDKNSIIVEPTSGNTGIGLVAVAATKNYKVILTMPDTMSIERQKLLKAYGAEIVLTEGHKGIKGAIEKAKEIVSLTSNAIMLNQFANLSNPKIHRLTTGPEIWSDTKGKLDFFISGVGTGGTITGSGEFLKSKSENIKVIAVEPYDSPVLSENRAGAHKLQGIGARFVPEILNTKIYDDIVKVQTEDAYSASRQLAKTEGILAGI